MTDSTSTSITMSEPDVSTPSSERSKRPASSPLEKDDIEKRLRELAKSTCDVLSEGGGGATGGGPAGSSGGIPGPVAVPLDQATVKAIADAVAAQLRPQISQELAELRGEVKKLRGELEARDRVIEELKEDFATKLDASEQYSRRSSVRVFGIPERKNESTDDIICRLGEAIGADVFLEDIDRSHRVGRQDDNKIRPIICKFLSYQGKLALMSKKKKLKSLDTKSLFKAEKVYINEDLTNTRAKLAKRMRDIKKQGLIVDTWTRDGVIYIKTPSEKIVRVTCEADLRIHELV